MKSVFREMSSKRCNSTGSIAVRLVEIRYGIPLGMGTDRRCFALKSKVQDRRRGAEVDQHPGDIDDGGERGCGNNGGIETHRAGSEGE